MTKYTDAQIDEIIRTETPTVKWYPGQGGKTVKQIFKEAKAHNEKSPCPICKKSGEVMDKKLNILRACTVCGGSGRVKL